MASKRIKFDIKNGYLPQVPCEYRKGFKVGSSACFLCKYRDRKNEIFKDMFVWCAYEDIAKQEDRKWY
jgi:hypothetical protein